MRPLSQLRRRFHHQRVGKYQGFHRKLSTWMKLRNVARQSQQLHHVAPVGLGFTRFNVRAF